MTERERDGVDNSNDAVQIGQTIDGWEIGSVLGKGTFSPVYNVSRDGVEGAMKIARAGAREPSERLRVEADALGDLDHAGIPHLLDKNLEASDAFVVMERAPGVTLLQRITEWNGKGRIHGEVESLDIITQLMDAVAYLHGREWVHRDIKDANVMYDGQHVSLIDFGFCKHTNQKDLRSSDSLWRAGAARFAPLGKLENHALAVPRQDVFAVGVLAYRLLTGQFPFGTEDGDIAGLKLRYAKVQPPTAHEVNRMVSPQFSKLIERMLEMKDDERVTSSEALEELHQLKDVVEAYSKDSQGPIHGRIVRAHRTRFPHVVRDPVAGDIRITDLEYRVLNSKEMQRLRWIRQLGLTTLIYPGADHSRLLHSIGTLNSTEKMFRAIEDESGTRIDSDTRSIARLYALTHDVGHIAMGHTIEDQLGYFTRHDQNFGRFERLLDPKTSQLFDALSGSDEGRAVIELLDPSKPTNESIAYQAVSGDMGADVLDYIDRDAYFCGLDNRVDSAIFRQLRIEGRSYSKGQRIISRISGKYGNRTDRSFAIDNLLNERYAMFLKVYTHSAKIAADAVLEKALRALTPAQRAETKFEWFGDETLLSYLATIRTNAAAAEYANMLKNRQLPRGVFRTRLAAVLNKDGESPSHQNIRRWLEDQDFLSAKGRSAFESKIAKESGIPASKLFFYVPMDPPGYKRAELWVSDGQKGSTHHASNDLTDKHLNLWEIWVFVASDDPTDRTAVGDAAEHLTGLRNMVDISVASPRLI